MKRAALILSLVLLGIPLAAQGDILLLKNGGRVEGIVSETADGYVVETVDARTVIRKDKVAGVVEAPYVTEVYEEKKTAIDAADPSAHFRLSLWCEGMGLDRRSYHHLMETLLLDPNHERARARLGHVRFRGVWMSPEEAKEAAMAAEGFVRFDGRWFTEKGLKAYLEAQLELQRVEEEVARVAAEREKAELEAKLKAEELKKKEAERKAVEAALAQAEEDRKERERLQRELAGLRDLVQELVYRGSIGFGYYGYAVPAGYLPSYGSRRLCGAWGRSVGPAIGFTWHKGNLRVRGLIR